jgi:hypothetical protein
VTSNAVAAKTFHMDAFMEHLPLVCPDV